VFSGFVDASTKIVDYCKDFVFFGYETGEKILAIFGNDNNPISFFATKADEWWKFWEWQIGIKINAGDFHFSTSFGVGEANLSLGWKTDEINFKAGINKIGIELSGERNGAIIYNEYYIRTIPTAILVLVCIYAPYLLPAAASAVFAGV
jgi:hypothetical protein